MKTLIWYRSILRQTLHDRLVEMGHKEVASRQTIEMLRERSARRIQTCGIDIEEEYPFGLNTQPIYLIPPMEPWDDKPLLKDLLYQKARSLVNDGRQIDCMWSGGLDSTATLLILNDLCAKGQLHVILSEGSIKEYPRLYEVLVKKLPHRISNGNIRSLIDYDNITVHGNEADTHYGMTGLATPLWKTNTFYFKVRYGHQNRVMRDLGGIPFDKIRIEEPKFKEHNYFIPHTESLFTDWDVTRWFIDMHLRNEIVFNRSPQHGDFKGNTYKEVDEKLKQYDVAKSEDFLCEDERELHFNTGTRILQSTTYQGLKMELRDFIAEHTDDIDYAYSKGDTASYSHGQIDMFESSKHPDINPEGLESRNVGVCLDGEVIRRDQLDSLDPYDFILP
jgi:hypothetical protein